MHWYIHVSFMLQLGIDILSSIGWLSRADLLFLGFYYMLDEYDAFAMSIKWKHFCLCNREYFLLTVQKRRRIFYIIFYIKKGSIGG